MRRARRSNLLTALSLLLCVAAIGIWVRGYRASDILHARVGGRWFYFINYPGRVGVGGWSRAEHDPVRFLPKPVMYQRKSPEWAAQEYARTGRDARRYVGFAGLAFIHGDAGSGRRGRSPSRCGWPPWASASLPRGAPGGCSAGRRRPVTARGVRTT